MTLTTPAVRKPPRRSRLDRPTLLRLSATEYERVAELLSSLTPDQWSAPTCCTGWNVRAMAGHLLGSAEMAASMRASARQRKEVKRRATADSQELVDALTAVQVEQVAHLSPGDVVQRYAELAPKAARGRRRTPWFVRRMAPSDLDYLVSPGQREAWTLGYLLDTILTRDSFLHRSDIATATGVPMRLTPDHEGLIVDDVVHEWAARHGEPVALHLTGPAGGSWDFGTGGQRMELDAIEFCRIVGGRGAAEGLLTVQVPF